jgi:hypothetical protein
MHTLAYACILRAYRLHMRAYYVSSVHRTCSTYAACMHLVCRTYAALQSLCMHRLCSRMHRLCSSYAARMQSLCRLAPLASFGSFGSHCTMEESPICTAYAPLRVCIVYAADTLCIGYAAGTICMYMNNICSTYAYAECMLVYADIMCTVHNACI